MAETVRVCRCVCARFAPGCAAALVTVVGGVWLIAPHEVTSRMLSVAGTELLSMSVGFGAAITLLQPPPGRARQAGPRSIAAGLLAPLLAGLISILLPAPGLPTIAVGSAVAGVLAGGATLQLYRLPGSASAREPKDQPAPASCPG